MDVFVVFFFKQKTAYEMRISDWSSDVCSSDLLERPVGDPLRKIPAVDGGLYIHQNPILLESLQNCSIQFLDEFPVGHGEDDRVQVAQIVQSDQIDAVFPSCPIRVRPRVVKHGFAPELPKHRKRAVSGKRVS